MRNLYQLAFFGLFILLLCYAKVGKAQELNNTFGVEVVPSNVEGTPIRSILILLEKDGRSYLADSTELANFTNAFKITPGSSFRQFSIDLAMQVFQRQPEVKSSGYKLYNYEVGGKLTLVITAKLFDTGDPLRIKEEVKKKFPIIVETERSKLTWILNGAGGFYHEQNGLFAQGPLFTQGNPVATNPAGEGPRFWGEFFIEPGIAGMTQLGKSKVYPYGAISYLLSGRNSSDIYSDGATAYGAVERLYGGVLLPRLGKNQNVLIDLSAGRQFFQLNDGFLFSRFSASANAGERGSVYLNSRTTHQMTGIAKINYKNFRFEGFYLEPQELFKDRQSDTRYLGGTFQYNNNKRLDLSLTYVSIVNSLSKYTTPQTPIPLQGLRVVNPKLWISNIADKGLFFKSELSYQTHATENMKSLAWYLGGGLSKKTWKYSPNFYYRYAFMQGDDPNTSTFERYDGLLTGGLGNWVQGLNFRKISGDGNLISHRVEFKGYLNKNMELSLDYFHLRAHQLSNLGSLPPLVELESNFYGQEVSATYRYFFGGNYLFLGIITWADPGKAVTNSFETPTKDWVSFQGTVFFFF